MKQMMFFMMLLLFTNVDAQAVLYKTLSPDAPYFHSEINETRDTITFYSEKGIDKIDYWNDIEPKMRVKQTYDGYKKVSICISDWPNANYMIYVSTNRQGIANALIKSDIVKPNRKK